ncbi:MAG: DUF6194 family protein [Pseudonocardia sp.]
MITTLLSLLDGPLPDLVALGEPTHREPGFARLRNRLLTALAQRGVRSVAIESDATAAPAVDGYVRSGEGTLSEVLDHGFSHGLGAHAANRELLARLRISNEELPPEDRIAFHGFDAPTESESAPSPRRHLEQLCRYLGEPVPEHLLGDDAPWADPAAQNDAARSVGRSAAARELRVVADDLVLRLHARAPELVASTCADSWHAAATHARAALGLLLYHAVAAEPGPARFARLMGTRDALMAENLLAIRARERHRGPTLVFAHNGHLQRTPGRWQDVCWWPAGAIVAATGTERYRFVAGSLGASAAVGLGEPAPGTFEHALADAPVRAGWVPDLRERDDVRPEHGYLPLTRDTLEGADAVLHLTGPQAAPEDAGAQGLAARILAAFPRSAYVRAGDGAPEVARGDRFFSATSASRVPFATIVHRDHPGHDEAGRLDRPGVFRLNIGAARATAPDADPAALDTWLPHPTYRGWSCILNPSRERLPEIDALLARARARAR